VGAVLGAALVATALWTVTRGDAAAPSDLTFLQDVPDDVRSESEETWQRFTDRFVARTSCWGPVSLELVSDVPDGDARYVAASSLIEIQIPTTPHRYRESLAHELAHHLERTCPQFDALRSMLEPMLGTEQQGWFSGSTWADVPSERFAEAVVVLVNGGRVRHETEVPVDTAVVEVVERWGLGEATDEGR